MQSNLKTNRLTLAPLRMDDTAFIQRLLNTPGWLRFIGDRNVHNEEDARLYIDKVNQNPTITYWSVSIDGQSGPIGIITLIRREYFEFPDLGFAFLPESGGEGYAFEAASAIIDLIREEGICRRLLAVTLPDNKASIRLLRRLGFDFESFVNVDDRERLLYYINLDNQSVG